MDFGKFIRECYLRSTPSVDLDTVTSDNPIDCCQYRLSVDEYDKILDEFEVKGDDDKMVACNMWMLQSGPSLYR